MANKYKNTKVLFNGEVFDSKLELKHYKELLIKQNAGLIKELKRQVKIKLGYNENCKRTYIADFVYFDIKEHIYVVMDSKGLSTSAFKIKRDWFLDTYYNCKFITQYYNKSEINCPFSNHGIDFAFYLKNI